MTTFTSTRQPANIPEIPIHKFVFANADEYGDSVAVVDGTSGFSLTYKQLKGMLFTVGKNLSEKFNTKKGEVIAILLPNHPLYPVYFHGVTSIGAVVTTINPLYTEQEIRKQLIDSGAKFLLTIPMFFEKCEAAVKDTGVNTLFLLSQTPDLPSKKDESSELAVMNANVLLAPPSDLTPVNVEINPKEDVAILPYSSGTTGVNKGVMLTHYNIVANLCQIDSVEHYTRDDVLIGLLPMFHIYGMVLIMSMSLYKGAKVVTVPKFDFVEFLTIIQKYKLTVLHLVPPIILALAKQPAVANFDLSSIKTIVSGAAPLAPTLQEELKQKYNIVAKQGYGLTEASPVLTVNPNDDNRFGSSGVLIANTELKVVSVESGELLEEGQEGELCFRGPQLMKGYLNNDEATKNTIKDGWLHTGDIGFIKDNHIYITDRLKELIKFKGYQVPPAELEAILLKHEKVSDAAVIGVPDTDAGELPKAFVVKKKDAEVSEEEIMTFVAEQVAPYKKLRFVEFIDEIPKSSAGKILRRVLKDRELAKQQQ